MQSRNPHHKQADHSKSKALLAAILFTFLAFIVQTIGAWWSGSLSLWSDTAHVLSDFLSLFLSFGAVQLASRAQSQERSFGWYRAEVLASFANGCLLLFVSIYLVWESIERWIQPHALAPKAVLIAAVLGLLLNLLSAFLLHRQSTQSGATSTGCGHHHGNHEHQHSHFHQQAHSQNDRNLHSAYLHVLSDAMGSVAVILGAVVITYTGWIWLDTLIANILAILVGYWAIRILVDSVHVLLEGTPRHIQPQFVQAEIIATHPKIAKVDDLHIWEITSQMYAATFNLHLRIDSLRDAEAIGKKIEEMLLQNYGISHVTIGFKSE